MCNIVNIFALKAEAEWLGLDRVPTRLHMEDISEKQKGDVRIIVNMSQTLKPSRKTAVWVNLKEIKQSLDLHSASGTEKWTEKINRSSFPFQIESAKEVISISALLSFYFIVVKYLLA